MVEHVDIPDGQIHEPKGASTASIDETYFADGVGSGSWKKIYTQGFEDYNDGGASQSLTSGSYVDLTNDGTGAYTLTSYRLPGYNAIWDTTNNQFDWSGAGLSLGDTVDIRFDFTVTTTGANDTVRAKLDMGHGAVGEYSLPILNRNIKAAGTNQFIVFYGVYMGDTLTLNNPAKIAMYTDTAGDSVVVNGWYVRTIPRNPVLL